MRTSNCICKRTTRFAHTSHTIVNRIILWLWEITDLFHVATFSINKIALFRNWFSIGFTQLAAALSSITKHQIPPLHLQFRKAITLKVWWTVWALYRVDCVPDYCTYCNSRNRGKVQKLMHSLGRTNRTRGERSSTIWHGSRVLEYDGTFCSHLQETNRLTANNEIVVALTSAKLSISCYLAHAFPKKAIKSSEW